MRPTLEILDDRERFDAVSWVETITDICSEFQSVYSRVGQPFDQRETFVDSVTESESHCENDTLCLKYHFGV